MTLKRLVKKIIGRDKPMSPDSPFKKISYSQSGEDIIIDYIFRLRNISTPSFLDLGCNHPFSFNNTFLFYNKGARGVNIDANPTLIKLFDQYRPLDNNINLGVGDKNGQMDFYMMTDSLLSTFSEDEAIMQEKNGSKISGKISIQIKTLDAIINEFCKGVYPDLLSIDVEGLDDAIVRSMNFKKSKPKVICIETVEYTVDGTGKKRKELIQMVVDAGYLIYADTNINTIFVDNEFWYNS